MLVIYFILGLNYKIRTTTNKTQNITFQTKGDPFLCFKYFQNIKQHFYYLLRWLLWKMEALDKSLSCCVVFDLFLNRVFILFQRETCLIRISTPNELTLWMHFSNSGPKSLFPVMCAHPSTPKGDHASPGAWEHVKETSY